MVNLLRTFFILLCLSLSLSACSDDVQALQRLIGLKPEPPTQSQPLPKIDAHDPQSQFKLANEYLQQNNLIAAMEWFSVCANAGYTPCIKELGYAYLQGKGVEPDPYLGMQLLQESLDEEDTSMLNDVAWFMATSSVSTLRNPDKALKLMGLLQQSNELDAMTADTLAAAQAASGDFTLAAKTQMRALNMLIREGQMAQNILQNYRNRLKLYRSGRAYTE